MLMCEWETEIGGVEAINMLPQFLHWNQIYFGQFLDS